MSNAPPVTLLDAKGQPYTPSVAPPLSKLLVGIFVAVAVLSTNGVYLASVTFLEHATGQGGVPRGPAGGTLEVFLHCPKDAYKNLTPV